MSTPNTFFLPEPIDNSSYPKCRPPKRLKHQIYDNPNFFEKVDTHAIRVAKNNYSTFRDLLWDLVFSLALSELEKARALFRWMTMCDMNTLKFQMSPKGSPEEKILAFKHFKTSYANLFELICSYAGLYCLTINGYVKCVDYHPGVIFNGRPFNHSWNVTFIEDSWQLIDCQWASRYLWGGKANKENVIVYQYDDFYFLMEPQQAIYSHFPQNPIWQLLREPLSMNQFESLPYIRSQFFKCGMDFNDQSHGVVYSKDGYLKISLGFGKPDSFTYKLVTEDSCDVFQGVPLRHFVIQETVSNQITFYFRFPAAGVYFLTVFVKELDKSNQFENQEHICRAACEYKLIADNAAKIPLPFPMTCHDRNWGLQPLLLSHYNLVPIQENGVISISSPDNKPFVQTEIKFDKMSEDVDIVCKLRKNGMMDEDILDQYIEVIETSNLTTFILNLPEPDEYGLEIYANEPSEEDTFTLIGQYLLDFEVPQGYKPQTSVFGPIKTDSILLLRDAPSNIRDMYDYAKMAEPMGILPKLYTDADYVSDDIELIPNQSLPLNERKDSSDLEMPDFLPPLPPPPPIDSEQLLNQNISSDVAYTFKGGVVGFSKPLSIDAIDNQFKEKNHQEIGLLDQNNLSDEIVNHESSRMLGSYADSSYMDVPVNVPVSKPFSEHDNLGLKMDHKPVKLSASQSSMQSDENNLPGDKMWISDTESIQLSDKLQPYLASVSRGLSPQLSRRVTSPSYQSPNTGSNAAFSKFDFNSKDNPQFSDPPGSDMSQRRSFGTVNVSGPSSIMQKESSQNELSKPFIFKEYGGSNSVSQSRDPFAADLTASDGKKSIIGSTINNPFKQKTSLSFGTPISFSNPSSVSQRESPQNESPKLFAFKGSGESKYASEFNNPVTGNVTNNQSQRQFTNSDDNKSILDSAINTKLQMPNSLKHVNTKLLAPTPFSGSAIGRTGSQLDNIKTTKIGESSTKSGVSQLKGFFETRADSLNLAPSKQTLYSDRSSDVVRSSLGKEAFGGRSLDKFLPNETPDKCISENEEMLKNKDQIAVKGLHGYIQNSAESNKPSFMTTFEINQSSKDVVKANPNETHSASLYGERSNINIALQSTVSNKDRTGYINLQGHQDYDSQKLGQSSGIVLEQYNPYNKNSANVADHGYALGSFQTRFNNDNSEHRKESRNVLYPGYVTKSSEVQIRAGIDNQSNNKSILRSSEHLEESLNKSDPGYLSRSPRTQHRASFDNSFSDKYWYHSSEHLEELSSRIDPKFLSLKAGSGLRDSSDNWNLHRSNERLQGHSNQFDPGYLSRSYELRNSGFLGNSPGNTKVHISSERLEELKKKLDPNFLSISNENRNDIKTMDYEEDSNKMLNVSKKFKPSVLKKPIYIHTPSDQYNNQYEDSYRILPSPMESYKPDESTANWTSGPIQKEPPKNFEPTPIDLVEEVYIPEANAMPNTPSMLDILNNEETLKIFQRIDDHAIEISAQHQDNFNQLIWQLIYARNITDELEKVRAIFLWLCTKNLSQMDFEHVKTDSPEEILMGLKSGTNTYAQIFFTLCRYAGLRCKLISGYAKGADYVPGMRFEGRVGEHSWNAVQVNETWRLFDCHWAARRLIGKELKPENVRYELDMFYFLTNPSQLIFTHFPHDVAWQLLHHPITIEEFESMAPVKSIFFKYCMELVTHKNAIINSYAPEFELKIAFSKSVREQLLFTFTLNLKDGSEVYNGIPLIRYGRHEIDHVNCHSNFWIRAPAPGSYKLLIYAKTEQSIYDSGFQSLFGAICEYKIEFTFPSRQTLLPFPPCQTPTYGPTEVYKNYPIESCKIISTIYTDNGMTEFKFIVLKPEIRVMAKLISSSSVNTDQLSEQSIIQRLISNKEVVITIYFPESNEYGLEIYANNPTKDGNSFYTIWQYFIIANKASIVKGLPCLPMGYIGASEPKFTNYGLSVHSHADPFIVVNSGNLSIQLKTSIEKPVRIMSQLIHCSNNVSEICSNQVLQQLRDSTIHFLIRLPNKGFFKLQIYALPFTETSENLPGVFNYLILSNQNSSQLVPFPQQFAQWKEGCYLYEPINGVLGADVRLVEYVPFRMDVPRAVAVAVVVNNDWTRLEKDANGTWNGKACMKLPWGKSDVDLVSVCANYGTTSDDSFTTILKYSIR